MKFRWHLLLLLIVFSGNISQAQTLNEFEKGKIIPSVACLEDKTETYALYLPKDYTPFKKWPIIIGFSPAARGTDPVTLCSEAAEKFGFIVIGSNNSKNGDSAPINKAYFALKKEIEKRFSIDPKRIYSIGFSGGSRVALRFASQEPDLFRGVIACGAFINPADTFKDKNIFIYGIVGDEDFNYSEYKRSSILDQNKVPYWVEIRKGPHQWPEKERVFEAIEMFDYLFQKTTEGKGLTQAETIIKSRMARVEQMITQKMWIHASSLVNNLLRNFEGNPSIDKIKALRKKLDDSPEYQTESKAENDFFECAAKVKQVVETPEYWQAFNKMQNLAKENTRLGNLGKATLGSLSESIRMSYKNISEDKGYTSAQKGLFFKVAHMAYPGNSSVPCIASFFYAQAKDKTQALAMLAEAAKLGFNDPDAVTKEKEFEFLKDDAEFIKTMAKITENKTAAKK